MKTRATREISMLLESRSDPHDPRWIITRSKHSIPAHYDRRNVPLIRYNPMIYMYPIKVLLSCDHSQYVSWSRVIHKRRTCFVIHPNRGVQILYVDNSIRYSSELSGEVEQ